MPRESLATLLERHSASLANCRRCDGADAAAVPILSGARSPRVMLVGQAPGRTETSDRRPFAGRAGRTLFRWLERAGIREDAARDQIYIAAMTRCYPGPSPSGRGDRVPTPRERALCADWLDAELRMIRPALLIPVGRLAVNRFVGTMPLEKVVGRAHVVTHAGGESLAVPLPHPSGASSWISEPGHVALLDSAIELIGAELSVIQSSAIQSSAARGAS